MVGPMVVRDHRNLACILFRMDFLLVLHMLRIVRIVRPVRFIHEEDTETIDGREAPSRAKSSRQRLTITLTRRSLHQLTIQLVHLP
jgi:hypothetical protein